MYNFSGLENKIKETEDWLVKGFASVRTGRATISLLDDVRIDSYGYKVPINQMGSITMEDAKTIRVVPWEPSAIQAIEKAVNQADLGVTAFSDEKGVRISFPVLTEETRGNILRLAKEKLEEARVSLRGSRDEAWGEIQSKEKSGELGEDEKFTAKEELEKMIKEANTKFEEMYAKKEKEIIG